MTIRQNYYGPAPRSTDWGHDGRPLFFANRNGLDGERLRALETIPMGQPLTVRDANVGGWSSSYTFNEVPGSWNTVMFQSLPMPSLEVLQKTGVLSDEQVAIAEAWLTDKDHPGRTKALEEADLPIAGLCDLVLQVFRDPVFLDTLDDGLSSTDLMGRALCRLQGIKDPDAKTGRNAHETYLTRLTYGASPAGIVLDALTEALAPVKLRQGLAADAGAEPITTDTLSGWHAVDTMFGTVMAGWRGDGGSRTSPIVATVDLGDGKTAVRTKSGSLYALAGKADPAQAEAALRDLLGDNWRNALGGRNGHAALHSQPLPAGVPHEQILTVADEELPSP